MPSKISIFIFAFNNRLDKAVTKQQKSNKGIFILGRSNSLTYTKNFFNHRSPRTTFTELLFIDDLSFNPDEIISLINNINTHEPVKTILYTNSDDAGYLNTVIDAGVKGILHKSETSLDKHGERIIESIISVSRDLVCYDSRIADLTNRPNWIRQTNYSEQLIGSTKYKQENDSFLFSGNSHLFTEAYQIIKQLTKREIEILKLIGEGKSNIEIAEKLFTSIRTIDTHKTNMIKKLGFKTTRELYAFAIENKTLLKNS